MNIDSDPLEPLHVLMAAARKQTLVLMVAVNDGNDELASVAALRIREAIRGSEDLAVLMRSDVDRRAAIGMIETTRFSAAPWLARAPQPSGSDRRSAQPTGRPVIAETSGPLADVIFDVDLNGARATDLDVRALELRGLRARGASLKRLLATGARLTCCDLVETALSHSRFDTTMIEDCNLERANLEYSSWSSARVARSNFAGALLTDARLDNAVFTDCDFRGADLSVVNSTLRDGLVSMRFLRCDLRKSSWDLRSLAGASFIDCKVYGIRGMPLHTARVEIERADVSPLADGSGQMAERGVREIWFATDASKPRQY